MNFDGAFIKERGTEFGIFVTTMDVLSNEKEAEKLIKYCEERIFPEYPVVLMAQDSQCIPHYYGKQDLIRFLEATNFNKIPFRRYTIP
jgi:hypothetical protein